MTTYTTYDFLSMRIGDLNHGMEHAVVVFAEILHTRGGGDWGNRNQG